MGGKGKCKGTSDDNDAKTLDTDSSSSGPVHESWSHRADGIITQLATSVGEGTLLKFPYLCARNGGGAFLIPFLLFSVLCALPLFYLEMVIGQYYQKGAVEVWQLCPAMKGMGIGCTLVAWIFAVFTPMYFAWYFYYLIHSFYSIIPWSNCDNHWNTDSCVTSHRNLSFFTHFNSTNVTQVVEKYAILNITHNSTMTSHSVVGLSGAAEEFWRLNVLDISEGLEHMGSMRWPLFGCLTVTFICMYLILFKGIRVTGKIVYLTFFCPIILNTILFIRAMTLPGSTDGLLYYIMPDFTKLKSPKLWIEACGYALHSMGTNTGLIITIASHNKFNNNCFKDSLLLVFGDAIITIFCGFAIFTVLGHLAWIKDVGIDHFHAGGFNIAFMVFPEAVTYLPLPQLWSVILFIMMITLGLDSTIPAYEVAMTVVGDKFPRLTRKRWLIVLMVMFPMYLLSFPYATQGGIYLLILIDWFVMVLPVMVFGIVQSLILAWVFGLDRLDRCTTEMYGQPVPKVIKFLIKFLTPILLIVIFAYALYEYRPPQYGDYHYPYWANIVGWLLAGSVVAPMPLWAIYSVWAADGYTLKEKIKKAFQPRESLHHIISDHKTVKTKSAVDSFL